MIFIRINSVLVLSTLHKTKTNARPINIKTVEGMLHDLGRWFLDLLAIVYKNKF